MHVLFVEQARVHSQEWQNMHSTVPEKNKAPQIASRSSCDSMSAMLRHGAKLLGSRVVQTLRLPGSLA
jgi:hypothetical protein